MTARDERLEAAMKAIHWTDGKPVEMVARQFLAMYDAVRAFDEQRKEVVQHSGEAKLPSLDNATAPAASPVGADPPWLDEATISARAAWYGMLPITAPLATANWRRAVRAVLRFAAAQPPSDKEIDEAANAIADVAATIPAGQPAQNRFARAALLAAARVRAGG